MEAGIWRAGWHFGCHQSVHLPTGGGGIVPKEREGAKSESVCVCLRYVAVKQIFMRGRQGGVGALLETVSEDFVY